VNNLTLTAFDPASPPQYVNATENSVLHYPAERVIFDQDLSSTGSGRKWSMPDAVTNNIASRQESNDVPEPKHPLRTTFTKLEPNSLDGKNIAQPPVTQILTNHFDYQISSPKLWEYKLTDFSGTRKDKIKRAFMKAIETTSFLSEEQNSFATNYFNSIVSGENLHDGITTERLIHHGQTKGWWALKVPDGDQTVELCFKLHKTIEMENLRGYNNSSSENEKLDVDDIARCMNMIISKSFDTTKVHQQAANKFFVKSARAQIKFSKVHYTDVEHPSHSLEIIRGYFYRMKPGMGKILLNFSLATSAFIRPILVNEFLADTATFTTDDKRKDALKDLRVYVITERKVIEGEDHARLNAEDARTKRVTALGPLIETVRFRWSTHRNGTIPKEGPGNRWQVPKASERRLP